ncbi:methyltransferase [Dyadobacter sp. CY345]|uniref:tRNA1(Val) (adenine(37)-N6)-methyltransferase n=1 Tax=Dyadobacter sp. CY345 TaxID=2909335 RepID=UPI001F27FDBD|nr:methyltransferase [Dyadobacter sp. CY345]MCF2444997.1 methyltransferase [Dyadobacter sp. CY345]
MARNSFFKFKQFTVQQDKCAMKVCTDACVFGGWADIESAEHILDIGTGTGLLSLMAAQRNINAKICAVELDADAFSQAKENIEYSPFANRIEIFHTAIQDFLSSGKFDCIISNPPFFQSDLRSPDAKINQAHHSDSLTFQDLLNAVNRLLTQTGRFNILLPVEEGIFFQELAEKSGLILIRKLTLFHQNGKKPFRSLMVFGRGEYADNRLVSDDLFIYDDDGKTYQSKFAELMKDFYLIF